jgi:hypothetical protein
MSNYGIGGNEVQTDASEAFGEIPQNRTLMAEKLTNDPPVKPQVIHGLQTMDHVFAHFNPNVDVEFEDSEGVSRKESLRFGNLGDFGIKGLTAQSEFLTDNTAQADEYSKIIKQLKTNKILKSAISDPTAKAALLESIYSMIAELQNNK